VTNRSAKLSADDIAFQEAIATRFECTRCGNCCKGDGLVHINPEEADRLAGALGLARENFIREYAVRLGKDRWRLKDKWIPSPNHSQPAEQWCIFLERDAAGLYGCSVNAAKPDQCASFPAGWRNPDSIRACPGLRILATEMAKERRAGDELKGAGEAKRGVKV